MVKTTRIYRMGLMVLCGMLVAACQVSIGSRGIQSKTLIPFGNKTQQNQPGKVRIRLESQNSGERPMTGSWEIEEMPDGATWLLVEFNGENRGDTYVKTLSEGKLFEWFSQEAAEDIEVKSDAGWLAFKGTTADYPRRGRMSFTPDEAFEAELENYRFGAPSFEQWLMLALDEVPLATPGLLQQNTTDLLSTAQLVKLIRNRVDAVYAKGFREAGYAFTSEQLLDMKRYYMKVDYAAAMRKAGMDYSAEELLEAKRHYLKPEWVAAMQKVRPGYGNAEMLNLKRHYIDADLIAQMDAAWPGMDDATIIKAKQYYLKPDYLAGLRKAGLATALDEAIDIKQHYLNVDDMTGMKAIEPGLTIEDMKKLKQHYLNVEQYRGYHELGITGIDDMIDLKNHYVKADYIAGMRKAGYDFSKDDLIELHRYNVKAEYAAAVQREGRTPLDAKSLIDVSRKGLDAETVRKLRD